MRSHFLRAGRGPIRFVDSAFTQANASTLTMTLPTYTTGDLLIAFAIDSGGTGGPPVWTPASGWTEAHDSDGRMVAWKIAGASETNPGFVRGTTTGLGGHIMSFRSAAFDVVGVVSVAGSPTVAPAITLSRNDSTVIAIFSSRATASQSYTTPTNYTLIAGDSDATLPGSTIFRRSGLNSGSTGTVSSTPSTGNGVGLLVGIKPIN